jgi:hypothetical protein
MKMAHVVDVRSPLTGGGSYAVYWCLSSENLQGKHVRGEILGSYRGVAED